MKSVDGTPKKVWSGNVCTSTPCFVDIRPRRFTISTVCFGPTAIWTSGGVTRFEYGPFVPKCRPSKETMGTAAAGARSCDPSPVGRIPRSSRPLGESTLHRVGANGSDGNVARPASSFEYRDAITEYDQAARIHFAEEPAVAVVLDQRRRLPLVRLDPLAHDVLPVVRPDDQRGAALVADSGLLRRIREDVVHGVVFRTDAPARVPLDQLLRLQEEVHRGVQLRDPGQRLRLRDRPREAVEDEALLGVRLLEPALRRRDHDVVGHELTRVHECLRLLPEVRALRHVVPQDVAGRDMRHAEVRRQLCRLGSLARAGWAEEDESHVAARTKSAVKRLWSRQL